MRFFTNDPSMLSRRRALRKHQTDMEARLWSKLRNKKFLGIKFYRQFSVGTYILDFYAPSAKLAIELDGSQHTTLKNHDYDVRRTTYLSNFGIRIIRFWDNEVTKNIQNVLERLGKNIGGVTGVEEVPPLFFPFFR